MRDLTVLSLSELLKNPPTKEEAAQFVYKWYKDRQKDYGDTYKDNKLILECGEYYLNLFHEILEDPFGLDDEFLEAEAYFKNKDSNFITFQNCKLIYVYGYKAFDASYN